MPALRDNMKKWYSWLVLALVFAIGGIINFFDGKSISAQIVQVCIAVCLAFIQFFCDKKGEKGEKVFKLIAMILSVILGIWIIAMILSMFV